ncbi:MAG: hypothetical protein U0263_15920 [Polyangiaceae bacterium]
MRPRLLSLGRWSFGLVLAGATACLEIEELNQASGGAAGTIAAGGSGGIISSDASFGGSCSCPSLPEWKFGWFGTGDAAVAAACPASLPDRVEGGSALFDPGCSPCACSAPTGGKCEVKRTTYADAQCKLLSVQNVKTVSATSCENLQQFASSVRFELNPSNPTCTATTDPLPPKFLEPSVFCGAPNPSCACSPASGPFTKRCALSPDGISTCPAELPDKHVLVSGVTDSRKCAGCSCAASGGSCAGATVAVCGQQNCKNCALVSWSCTNSVTSIQYTIPAASAGTCTPNGTPGMTGTLTPLSTQVVCCEP